ncbi:hypothetical protein PPL_09638 [Heterostelium album PN500]|uniref:Pesticidal crystal protein domain-containing protein n=1 Tax=Heterostelium pallidum (strain ATCC 26659 / Pp 5 / PN500) TaxID=670386 RepID=D3BNW7_HETP5|nr:hypothetical protein PPL_09638 [Heterostelium album PN500]EFA76886.1 hypothetical protein PPL_09638 [Heterostelium album PN500]|eukprot:XP_020429018.1 hypothetical protein PPL_09638 [Heterostelium album PN500]
MTTTAPTAHTRSTFLSAQVDKLVRFTTNQWTPENLSSSEAFKSQVVAALSQSPKNGSSLAFAASGFLTYSANDWKTTDKEYKGKMMMIEISNYHYQDSIIQLIGDALPIYDANVVDAIMRGCALSFQNYTSHLKIWQNNKTSEALKEAMRITFNHFETDLATYYMSMCTKPGYEVDELDEFAAIANFHLIVLRDVCIYGTQWGFKDNTVNLYKNKLKTCIVDYEAYACDIYEKGYNKVLDQIAANPPKYQVTRWNKINEYKRNMNRFVFDYVSNFWYYNIDLFPNGVNVERVRYIFSDIMGIPCTSSGTALDRPVEEIIKVMNNNKRYLGELQSIDYYRSTTGTRIINIQPNYWSWESSSNKPGSKFGGQTLNGTTEKKTVIIDSCNPAVKNTKFSAVSDLVPRSITFENGQIMQPATMRPETPPSGATDIENQYISVDGITKLKDISYSNHKIATIVGVGVNKMGTMKDFTEKEVVDAITIGFSLNDTFTENMLMKDIVSVVDAQKFATIDNDSYYKNPFMSVNQVMFGNHAMHFYTRSKCSYYFNKESDQSSEYYFAIYIESYYGTEATTIKVISPKNNDTLLGTFTLKPGDKHVIIPMDNNYKCKFGNAINAGVQLELQSGDCHIVSLLFTPGHLTPFTRTNVSRGAKQRNENYQVPG